MARAVCSGKIYLMLDIKKQVGKSSITILLLTAIAYTSAYVYDVSYLSVFDINWRFAQVQIPILIISLATIGVALYVTELLLRQLISSFGGIRVFSLSPQVQRLVSSELRLMKVFIYPILISIATIGTDSSDMKFVLIVTGIFALAVFISQSVYTLVPVILKSIKYKSISKGVEIFYKYKDAQIAEENEIAKGRWTEPLSDYLIPSLIIFAVAFIGGRNFATGNNEYPAFTLPDGTINVIVRVYDDEVITKRLNKDSNTLENGYRIFDVKEINSTINSVRVEVKRDLKRSGN